jgi:hypothetical protein
MYGTSLSVCIRAVKFFDSLGKSPWRRAHWQRSAAREMALYRDVALAAARSIGKRFLFFDC